VLVDTIRGVLGQSHANLELLVVDQSEGHEPATEADLAAIDDPRFDYRRVVPPSVTAARNFSLSIARGPIVLFLDDDVVLHADLAKHHLAAHEAHADITAVAGRVMQDGLAVCDDPPRFDEHARPRGHFTASRGGYTNALPGGNFSVRIEAALAVGGFDTRYYGNGFREESDFSMKMVRAGMRFYYEPRAELLHLASPMGGSRAVPYRSLHDSPMFYRNEIFFTLRAVGRGQRLAALRRKYQDYSRSVTWRRACWRLGLFVFGIGGALWRLAFGRPTVAREV
jgi:GT2 family glycosyltransferase